MSRPLADDVKADRCSRILLKYPESGADRFRLGRQASTPMIVITGATVTRIWPKIEKRLTEAGYYGVRPIIETGWMCIATKNPRLAMLSQYRQKRYIQTRIGNLVVGDGTLEALISATVTGVAVNASRLYDAYQGLLDSFSRYATQYAKDEAAALATVKAVKQIPVSAKP